MNDEPKLLGLFGSPEEREAALKALYLNQKLRGFIIGFVRNNGGNQEDGKDILQDALIILDRQVRLGGYKGTGTVENYLQGIAHKLWIRKRQQWNERHRELNETNQKEEIDEGPEVQFLSNERKQLIDQILTKLGKNCKAILNLYKLQYSMEEIAIKIGFASKEVARNEAYKCRKRFREHVKGRKDYLDLLGISKLV